MNQKSVFSSRLARVASHTGNTNATLHIGMEDQLPKAAFLRESICGSKLKARSQGGPLALAMALVSGAAGWIWGQWMRVTLFTPEDALVALVADLTIGITAILLLRAILGLRGVPSLTFQIIGLSIALLGLHNAVHLWPDHFAMLFPSQWISATLSGTEPMSVNLGGFATL